MVLCAMFAALIAVGAFIRIPIPYVPFTLQLFFTTLAGLLLGPKLGAASSLVYMITGLIGIPIFTEGGGPGYIFRVQLRIYNRLCNWLVCNRNDCVKGCKTVV